MTSGHWCLWAPLLLILALPGSADAQRSPSASAIESHAGLKEYKCSKGSIRVGLETQDRGLAALVLDDKLYVLATVPWKADDGTVVTWSDGVRTLTWSPGVVLHWKNGTENKTCVNGVTHHRDADL